MPGHFLPWELIYVVAFLCRTLVLPNYNFRKEMLPQWSANSAQALLLPKKVTMKNFYKHYLQTAKLSCG